MHCLFSIVERVIKLIGLQFIIFEKPVIGAAWEQKRRQIERINRFGPERFFKARSQIYKIMMNDVVSADKIRIGYKGIEIPHGRRVKRRTITFYRSQILDLFVLHSDFAINVNDGFCHDVRYH